MTFPVDTVQYGLAGRTRSIISLAILAIGIVALYSNTPQVPFVFADSQLYAG